MNKKILLKTLLPISTIALLGGGIASSLTLTSCSKKSEKALEINVLTSTITRNGVKLDIEGSYSTFNFDSPTIELVDKENSFKPFEASNGIFIATLPANTDIGTYKLQLVAKNGDDNIYSNTITFIVGPFAASDGSNWSGRKNGTVWTNLNPDMTATILSNRDYVAENLVIPEYVFENGKFYKVIGIYDGAFGDCINLTGSLTIPDSVTSIGEWAFVGCSGLTGSLTIGSGVESIGIGAFGDCINLTGSLTIPDSVTSIGESAFYGCWGLTGSLTIGSSVESIGTSAFINCERLTGSLTIPDNVVSIGENAFNGCSGFTGSLTIGSSVESIGTTAFQGCAQLTGGLTIPNSVKSIGASAFRGCSGFRESLTIGNGVIRIGQFAFESCSGFNNITLDGYDESPTWDSGEGIFMEWNNDSSSTVSTSSGTLTAAKALEYLNGIGLPPDWTAAETL